jgi:hypothetical protein
MKRASSIACFLTIIAISSCGLGGKRIDGNGQTKSEERPVTQTEKTS